MKQKKIPQRMCVGCQEMKNKKELIRVVRAPDGTVSLDPSGKKAGRGGHMFVLPSNVLPKPIKKKDWNVL